MVELKIKNNDVIILKNGSIAYAINNSYARLEGKLVTVDDIYDDIEEVTRKGSSIYTLEGDKLFVVNEKHNNHVKSGFFKRKKLLGDMKGLGQ